MTALQIVQLIGSLLGIIVGALTLAVVLLKGGRLLERDDRQQKDIDVLFKWHREHVETSDSRWREIGIGLAKLGGRLDAVEARPARERRTVPREETVGRRR